MFNNEYYGSNYYASIYYGVLRGDEDAIALFARLSLRDIQYEALILVTTPSDTRTMEHAYWLNMLGGRGTTGDIMYEGIILGLGFTDYKEYYDNMTSTTWPDRNTSEKMYWLKVITDNI